MPLCVTRGAEAQEFLKDRRYQEGIGVRAGDFELHPGIAGEIGYDSNWFQRSNKEGPNIANGAPTAPPIDGGLLRITPSLSFSTIGKQRQEGDTAAAAPPTVTFRGGVAGTYREFFGKQELRDQRNMSAQANLRLDILPQRPLGFGIFGLYERAINPNASADLNQSYNRDDVGGGLEVITVPGGGTLDWRFGYQVRASLFEESAGVGFNNLTHEAYTKGRWRFRPRTAFMYDGTARFRNYLNPDRVNVALHDSTPIRARLGINGLVTSRFAFLGMVGWGSSFNRPASLVAVKQYDSVIGQAEFKFFLTPSPGDGEASDVSLLLSSIAVGYNRDFQASYIGDYYGSDRGYAKVQYMFAGRLLFSLEGGLGAVEYPDIFFSDNTFAHASWTDLRADGTLFGEYRFSNTFGLNTTFRYTANFSDTQLPLAATGAAGAPGGTGQVFDMNWRRFEAFLGARWFL
jgi:hypothetical protein